jgi:putative tryptophan/tyrosine transport system substrate-binding protein
MDRRRFLAMSMAGVLPPAFAAEAQPPARIPRVGLLAVWPETSGFDWSQPWVAAFRERMHHLGYIDGRNVSFEARRGPVERVAAIAAELVDLHLDVIVVWSSPGVAALKRRTTSIPIVMAGVGDAVNTGLVASLARPGGNITGVSFQASELLTKRVQLIREIVPGASRIGVLWDSRDPAAANVRAGIAATMKIMPLHFELIEAETPAELDKAFAAFRRVRADGVAIMPSQRYGSDPGAIAKAALDHRLPTVFGDLASVKAGGLMTYSADWPEMARMAAGYVDRILKGAKAADLPVEQPTKFQLMVNLRTAKTLGLALSPALLLRADHLTE